MVASARSHVTLVRSLLRSVMPMRVYSMVVSVCRVRVCVWHRLGGMLWYVLPSPQLFRCRAILTVRYIVFSSYYHFSVFVRMPWRFGVLFASYVLIVVECCFVRFEHDVQLLPGQH